MCRHNITRADHTQEITVSYLPDNMGAAARSARRAYLLKHHNFVCGCAVCSLEGADLDTDEESRHVASRRVGQ